MPNVKDSYYVARADQRRVSVYYDDIFEALEAARIRAAMMRDRCRVMRRSDRTTIAHQGPPFQWWSRAFSRTNLPEAS